MTIIAGVDEVGRGCLAGPVMASAVILPELWQGSMLKDSKKMTAKARELAYYELKQSAQIGFGSASVAEIDEVGIGKASLLAMARAVKQLPVMPDVAWVDGKIAPDLECAVETFVGGDDLHQCISAASIIAKVERDQWMLTMAAHFPEYGFADNKGYGTKKHLAALKQHGPCRLHRFSFAPVRAAQ